MVDEDVTDWGEVNMEEKRRAGHEDLKRCPFCGDAARRVDIEDEGDNFGGSCIECTSCGASTALHFDRKENLYSSWNERAADAVHDYDDAPTDPHHGGKVWKP